MKAVYLLCVIGLTELLVAQNPDALALNLVKSTVVPGTQARAFVGHLGCDGEGNLYFNGMSPNGSEELFSKVDVRKGEAVEVDFHNPELQGFRRQLPYAVTENGDLYAVAWKQFGMQRPEAYIVRFNKDGQYKSKIKLQGYFSIRFVVPFDERSFLIGGRKRRNEGDKQVAEYFTAIFDDRGREVKTLTFPGEEGTQPTQPEFAANDLSRPLPNNRSIELGSMIPGPTGSVLVMRRTSPAALYVVLPTGEVARRLELAPPEKRMYPSSLHYSNGQVAVRFHHDGGGDRRYIRTFNITDGTPISTFDVTNVSSAVSCFSAPGKFTVLENSKEGKLAYTIYQP